MSVGVFEEKRPMDVSCGNMSMDVAPKFLLNLLDRSYVIILKCLISEADECVLQNRLFSLTVRMGLYFSRLFLRDQYSVALDKFGQKQLKKVGQSVKIKSEITPDNAGLSGASSYCLS